MLKKIYIFVLGIGNIKTFDRNDSIEKETFSMKEIVLVSHCCCKKKITLNLVT